MSQSILDTTGEGSNPIDTRHKWDWLHPGRYSTQLGMAAPRSILDTNGDFYIPVDRYSIQMMRTVPMSVFYKNGEGCIHVDSLHKWCRLHCGRYSTQFAMQPVQHAHVQIRLDEYNIQYDLVVVHSSFK